LLLILQFIFVYSSNFYNNGRTVHNTTILNHPLINHHLAKLRDKNTREPEFRRRLAFICKLMVYEISQDLPTKTTSVETPLERADAVMLACDIVVVSILRAGLAMQDAFVELYPEAKIGHFGFYRDEETLTPVRYYDKLPETNDHTLAILCDPMLATGGSLNAAITLLKQHNITNIRCLTLVAAPEGIEAVESQHPDVRIFSAALDRQLNEKGYILPGLGDAGDRQFGTV